VDPQKAAGDGARPLVEALASVPDPRSAHGRRHPLGAVLALAVCAMLCGCRSLYAIAQWGRDEGSTVTQALGFTRATTPCVATLHLLFRRLDRGVFEAQLGAWFQEQGLEPDEALAVDGKTLRGIHGESLPGVHLVAAYAHRTGMVVGQHAADGKGQELATVLALLERVPLQGRVVTGDAQFAQREVSRRVVAKGGTTSGS
jgi:hypothetical protein